MMATAGFGSAVGTGTVSGQTNSDSNYDYAGRAEDAEWREQAHEYIEEIRKVDFDVNVVNPGGEPVEGAAVEVEMQEHDFDFGGEFALSQIAGQWNSEVAETYRQTFLENFNKAALTNSLKASPWSGEELEVHDPEIVNPENAKRAIRWLLDHDIPNRGHTLVWEEYDWMNIDPSLSNERINELVKQRIRTRASEFRGDLPEWDLHNHPIWQSNIRDDLGQEAALEWWAAGHDAAPDAQMYINEMNIIAGSSYRDPYEAFISWLMEHNAGVEGIGFMGHFDIEDLTPPEELLSTFDRFGEFGVPLQITEFDVQSVDRDDPSQVSAQADYVRDVLTAAFSHEAVEGVMSWCFWDQNGGARRYYDVDWTLRPHGEEYQRLVFDEWWTEETGETDEDGVYATDGFKGRYEITAQKGALSGEATATFDDDNGTVAIELTPPSGSEDDKDEDNKNCYRKGHGKDKGRGND